MCWLRVSDCMLSADSGLKEVVILQLRMVKSRTRGARFQSVRLDEPFVIHFMRKCFAVMSPKERIWPYSAQLFRTQFYQLCERTCGHSKLVFPSSLRPGGATYLFQLWGEDVSKLQWRGRWLHMKTLIHYVQELGALNVMSKLSLTQKNKVSALAALCETALAECVVAKDSVTLTFQVLELWHRRQTPFDTGV
eukprot:s2641_g7.t2